jgi:hypothetical protein
MRWSKTKHHEAGDASEREVARPHYFRREGHRKLGQAPSENFMGQPGLYFPQLCASPRGQFGVNSFWLLLSRLRCC